MLYKSLNFEVKSVSDGGEFEGYAAVFGNLDRTGDIILPGAFKETLPTFLAEGIIAWQHDWSTPIGKPLDASEDSKGLFIKAMISDTEAGRDARTLMKDGVVRKMSIGYDAAEYDWLDADNIASYLGAGYAGYSLREIQRACDWGRALKKINLYEVSPVSVPANREADITGVKGVLPDGTPLEEQFRFALAASNELTARFKSLHELRQTEGRKLSESNRARLKSFAEALVGAQDALSALLEGKQAANESGESEAAQAAYLRFKMTALRELGVEIN